MRSAGAIVPLIDLLRVGTTETLRLHGLAALSSAVARNTASQNAAREAGAMRVVATLLADSRLGSAGYGSWDLLVPQHAAHCALYLVANNTANQAALREAGGTAALSALTRAPGGAAQGGEAARTALAVLHIIEPPAPQYSKASGAPSTGTRSRVVVPVDETEMVDGTA